MFTEPVSKSDHRGFFQQEDSPKGRIVRFNQRMIEKKRCYYFSQYM